MIKEYDGRARMAAAQLLLWFYGLKSPAKEIAQFLYIYENQWYLSGQDIYTKEDKKDPNLSRWIQHYSEDLSVWLSQDECVFYTFVDPYGSMMYFGHGINNKDKAYQEKHNLGVLNLEKLNLIQEKDNNILIDCGIIEIINKKTWNINVALNIKKLNNTTKYNRIHYIQQQIESHQGIKNEE